MELSLLSIVFTCHNRIEKTRNCLNSLVTAKKQVADRIKIIIYVCDDNSTDGTTKMLNEFADLPIKVIEGDGELFWAKGMAKAMELADQVATDYYLFINDDVIFYPDFLVTMFRSISDKCAVVGCTLDNEEKECSYGAFTWDGNINRRKNYHRVTPESDDKTCKWANWNCFLISSKLYNFIGKIDDFYEHGFADYDYSNRIIEAGYSIVVADQYIGTCNRNGREGTYLDYRLTMKQRFKLMHKKTGRPIKSSWHYAKKFFGIGAIKVFLEPYIYVLITSFPLYKKIKYKNDKV